MLEQEVHHSHSSSITLFSYCAQYCHAHLGATVTVLHACLPPSLLQAIQALLKQNPSLVYSHSKAGENLWHFAAQGGHAEVGASSAGSWRGTAAVCQQLQQKV
jgi:hypothetical protein